MEPEANYTVGSGNVFADIDRPDAQEALIKAELARHIGHIIDKQKLTQKEAAQVLGIDQPKVSNLLRGRLSGFSTDRLLRFLNALGRDIEIVIVERSPKEEQRVGVTVVGAGR